MHWVHQETTLQFDWIRLLKSSFKVVAKNVCHPSMGLKLDKQSGGSTLTLQSLW